MAGWEKRRRLKWNCVNCHVTGKKGNSNCIKTMSEKENFSPHECRYAVKQDSLKKKLTWLQESQISEIMVEQNVKFRSEFFSKLTSLTKISNISLSKQLNWQHPSVLSSKISFKALSKNHMPHFDTTKKQP